MASQKRFSTWGIIYHEREEKAFKTFSETFKLCLDTFKFKYEEPKRTIKVVGRDDQFSNYERYLKELNSSVEFLIFILPG